MHIDGRFWVWTWWWFFLNVWTFNYAAADIYKLRTYYLNIYWHGLKEKEGKGYSV